MAEFEERDFTESDSRQYSESSEHKSVVIGVTGLLVAGLAILLVWFGWGQYRSAGTIPQTRIMDVRMSGEWQTGAFRTCQTDGVADVLFCPKPSDSRDTMATGDLASRSLTVSFYGNIPGNHQDTLNWNCKWESESIICHSV